MCSRPNRKPCYVLHTKAAPRHRSRVVFYNGRQYNNTQQKSAVVRLLDYVRYYYLVISGDDPSIGLRVDDDDDDDNDYYYHQ